MGVVFQDFRLLPDKTVYENVAFAMYIVKATPRHIRRQVPMVLSLVGLSGKAKMYPNELSGGEQQRVALARALVNNPSMLIADEPTGNLDPDTAWEIMNLLNNINLRGTTVVVATHAKDIVDKMKKRVIQIDKGIIVRDDKKGGMIVNYNIVSYLIGEGFKNVLKNKKSTFAAFIIMFVTMITVGLGIAGGSNITSIINQLENDFPINVYIEDTASQDDIKDMEEQIKSIEYVNNVTYTSKEKALEKERESLGDTANVVLNSYTESNHPFPASFTVTLTDLEKSSEVISILQQLDKVKKDENGNPCVITKQDTITGLNKVKKGIRIAFFSIGVLLIVISTIIISNTIKLTVHARRREISIMKYVGATNNFIRAPFIVEVL